MARPALDFAIRARDKTKQAFSSAQRRLDGLVGSGGRLAGLFRAAGPIGAGIASIGVAAAAAVAGLAKLIKGAVDFADAIDKAADRAGIGVELFQALRIQGELGGASYRASGLALQRWTRRLGEAVAGTGTLRKSLDELGISVFDNQGQVRASDAVLEDFVERLKGVGTVAEQNRLIFTAFDAEGLSFGRALVNAEQRLSSLTEQYKAAGLVLDQDFIRRAVVAKDQMTLLGTQFKVAGAQVGITLIPAFQAVLPLMTALAVKAAIFADNLGDFLNIRPDEGLKDQLEDITAELDRAIARDKQLGGARGGRSGSTPEEREERITYLTGEQARLQALIDARFQARLEKYAALRDYQGAALDADQSLTQQAQTLIENERKALELRRKVLQLKLEQGVIDKAQYDLEIARLEGVEKEAATEKTITELAQARLDAENKAAEVQREYNRLKQEQVLAELASLGINERTLEYLRHIAALKRKANEDQGDANDQADEAIKKHERILELTSGIANAFANLEDEFSGWVRLLGQGLDLWLRYQQTGAPPIPTGTTQTNAVAGRHAGGSAWAGQPYRVNEPSGLGEVFVPGVNGRILSRSDAMAMGGPTYIFNFSGADYAADWAEQAIAQAPLLAQAYQQAAA